VYECHVCAHSDHQKRWLTKHTRKALLDAVAEMDADYCLALHPDPYIIKMLERFGFKNTGMVNILDVKEYLNGTPYTQATGSNHGGTGEAKGREKEDTRGPQ